VTSNLSVAVIGLGFGAVHARVLFEMEDVTLAAVCDLDAQRRAAVTRGRNVRAYDDYRRLLQDEKLDAAIVAVPTRLHEEVAAAAIEAGLPLLVEKPLAPAFAEGQRLVEKAAKAGVPLMTGHIERFNPVVVELKRRLDAGEAGRVLQVGARRLGPFNARTRDVGVIHDLAYHDIDVMRFLLGREVERVQAEAQTGVRTPLEDSVAGLLRFGGEDSPVATIEANWLTPRKVRELWLLGERGLFTIDGADNLAPKLEFQAAPDGEGVSLSGGAWSAFAGLRGRPAGAVRIAVEPREPLERELSAFIDAVRGGGPMPVSPNDALATLATADALAEAARSGQPVAPARLG
jgi:predicted dehydrogenase